MVHQFFWDNLHNILNLYIVQYILLCDKIFQAYTMFGEFGIFFLYKNMLVCLILLYFQFLTLTIAMIEIL